MIQIKFRLPGRPMTLPGSLQYWRYEGSLTTPPCAETVDWIVCLNPVTVAREDIARFTALYPMNARPVQELGRRFVLQSS
jgi:carbonic anhydrase